MPRKASDQYYAETRFLFHSHVKVKTPVRCGEALPDACFAILEHFDKHYNSYSEGSFFDRINRRAGSWMDADEHVLYMLREISRISAMTGGAYNITLMPLLRLWGFYSEDESDIPSAASLRRAVEIIRQSGIEIRGNQVRIAPGQEIITGSFIKAYAVDQVLLFLKSEGVTDALINAGGSTISALNDDLHPCWVVKIPHPDGEGFMKELPLKNASFSLSGRKEHFRLIAGKAYGHIINAATGWPSSNLQSAVIAGSAFLSDVLSTALFAVAPDDAGEVSRRLGEVYDFSYYLVGEHWQGEKTEFIHYKKTDNLKQII